MEIGIIFSWFILAILVGIAGKNKQIGFATALILALILSPLIRIIIVLLSKPKKDINEQFPFLAHKELAKKAEFKGNIDAAIDHYMDSLYSLHNDFKALDKKSEEGRQRHIKSINEKIEELKNLKSGESSDN